MHKFTKGSAHTVHSMHGPKNPSEHRMCQVRNCVREKMHTYMNGACMDIVNPSTTYGPAPNTI
jgi:hypothetical protein